MTSEKAEESSPPAAVAAPVQGSGEGSEAVSPAVPAAPAPAAPAAPAGTGAEEPATPAEPADVAAPAAGEREKEKEESGAETEHAGEAAKEGEEEEEEKADEKKEEEKPATPPPPPPPATSRLASTPAQAYARQESTFMGVPTTGLKYPIFLHNNFLLLFVLIGMIFTLIGGILSGTARIAANSDIYGASIITISLGLFTIGTFLTLAALFRDDLNQFIRLGLLITGAIAIFGLILYSSGG